MKKTIAIVLLAVTAVAAFFLIRFMTKQAPAEVLPAESESVTAYELEQGEVAVSLAFNNLAGVFSGELRPDDIVAVLPLNPETGEYEWSEDLAGLRVLSVLEGPVKTGSEELTVLTVTLQANELQAETLATLSRSGDYHIVLMKRGKV